MEKQELIVTNGVTNTFEDEVEPLYPPGIQKNRPTQMNVTAKGIFPMLPPDIFRVNYNVKYDDEQTQEKPADVLPLLPTGMNR